VNNGLPDVSPRKGDARIGMDFAFEPLPASPTKHIASRFESRGTEREQPMSRRNVISCAPRSSRYALLTFAVILSLAGAAFAGDRKAATVGGPFTLTAPDGATVTDRTYRGKWLLVFFGFTFCPNTCPTTLMEIAEALKRLGPEADRVQPLFITIDPKRDTPDALANFTGSFDRRIVGLTGTHVQIAAVAQAYGAYFAEHRIGPGPDDYLMDHGTYIYLMNAQGQFVRAFDADTQGDDIAKAVRAAMNHTKQGAGDDVAGAVRQSGL
jgi:protein SCO1/2